MAITTRSEYGLRAMILLAEQFGDELLSAKELARRESIPPKYLEQILAELKRSGLVVSQAGARGGYRLARPARDIRVSDIVSALDGRVAPTPDTRAQDAAVATRLRPLWERLERAMRGVLESTTLDQLRWSTQLGAAPPAPSADEPAPDPDGGPMYHI
jgi:Rrf2 family protein